MLFNSHIFLFGFLPLSLLGWWALARHPQRRLFLLVCASYVFYGYWAWSFVLLMFGSTLVDFICGARIRLASSTRVRRAWLWTSIATNLGILAVFKYAGFFTQSVSDLADALGLASVDVVEFALPIGISFYTFQSMSYSIDIYRRKVEPASSFISFAAYVSMFPQLVAGPIVRYTDIADQFNTLKTRLTAHDALLGIQFLVLGLSKKLLLADYLARDVDLILGSELHRDLVCSWLAMLGYTLQIYFDFSGYSDMAVGLGLLLGFSLPQNFDSPYRALNPSDFWRRWHISLSEWLRDYLYVSLGGNRAGRAATLRNIGITMLLGGLWHGASWNFVLWGLFHAGLLVAYHLWAMTSWTMPAWLARTLMLLGVIVGWVFFRAADLPTAISVLASMLGVHGASFKMAVFFAPFVALIAVGFGICFFAKNTWELERCASQGRAAVLAVLAILCVLHLNEPSPFLYFRF